MRTFHTILLTLASACCLQAYPDPIRAPEITAAEAADLALKKHESRVSEASKKLRRAEPFVIGAAYGKYARDIELQFPGYPDHLWEITELSEDETVRLRLLSGPTPWVGSELRFQFAEAPDQVFVTLGHFVGEETPEEHFLYFNTKWPTFLLSLKQYLETGTGMPYPNDLKIQNG